jgi:hypothetical protein
MAPSPNWGHIVPCDPPKSAMPFKKNLFKFSVIFMHPNHSIVHKTGQNYPSSPTISVQEPVLAKKIP